MVEKCILNLPEFFEEGLHDLDDFGGLGVELILVQPIDEVEKCLEIIPLCETLF